MTEDHNSKHFCPYDLPECLLCDLHPVGIKTQNTSLDLCRNCIGARLMTEIKRARVTGFGQ